MEYFVEPQKDIDLYIEFKKDYSIYKLLSVT